MDLFFYSANVDDAALALAGANSSRMSLSSIRPGVLVLPEAAEEPCSPSALQLRGNVLDGPSALSCLSSLRYACQGFLASTAGECSPDESCFYSRTAALRSQEITGGARGLHRGTRCDL